MRSSIISPKQTKITLDQVKINNMNCFFSEISQLNSNSSSSQSREGLLNCNFTYDSQSILIITKGGNQFYLPLDQQITRVFPMIEGILIQYQVKAESKLKEILYYQKNKAEVSMDIEQPQQEHQKNYSQYCYATITRHPLNPIKLLGQVNNMTSLASSQITGWYKSKQKVITPVRYTPLLLSYNSQLHRNAINIMLVNLKQLEQQKCRAYLPTHTYSLKNMNPTSNSTNSDKQSGYPYNSGSSGNNDGNNNSTHYEILTHMIYESNEYQSQIVQAEVMAAKSNKIGQIYLYVIDAHGNLKIYEINNVGYYHNKFSNAANVTLYKKIENVGITMGISQLYSQNLHIMQPYQCHRDHQNKSIPIDLQIIYQNLQLLSDCIVILQQNSIRQKQQHSLCYYYRGQKIWSQNLQYQAYRNQNSSDMVDEIKQDYLRIKNNQLIQIINQSQQVNIKTIQPLISGVLDAIIVRNMQITLSQSEHFAIFLHKFKALDTYQANSHQTKQQQIVQILLQMEQAKIPVLNSLHQLLQQLKLYQVLGEQRLKLGSILMNLVLQMNYRNYVDYYLRNGVQIPAKYLNIKQQAKHTNEPVPFSVYQLLNKILTNSQQLPKFPIICIYRHTGFIINFVSLFIKGLYMVTTQSWNKSVHSHGHQHPHTLHREQTAYNKNIYPLFSSKVFQLEYYTLVRQQKSPNPPKSCTASQLAFLYLIKHRQTQNILLRYSLCVRLIACHLVSITKQSLPPQIYKILPQLGFALLSRQDLYKNLKMYMKMDVTAPFYLQKPSFNDSIKTLVQSSSEAEQYFYNSNTPQINKINHDLIFEEVGLILSSTSQIKIRIKDIDYIPDHKWESQSQNILMKFANRKVSVIIGQGAFFIGTSRSFITDIIKIPKINLQGLMPNDIKVTLDLKQDKQSLLYWPQFHAGMVAGLKLSRHVIPLSQDHLKTWIFYQKPDNPKRDHSGFLLSLGLLGYLKCFSPTDIYQYLKPNNQFTSVAILLGCSASNIGRSDQSLSKTLILHIPVLLPPGVDLQIPINVQTSALIGIGLLHKGTCNRTMTEMTLSQIGKKPCTDKCLDRQGYSLAAGWALGMICLGVKGAKDGFRDLRLQQRLIRFIEGGKIMQPPQSMMSTNFLNDVKCSSIKQGPNVNLHITAPAALLAISLMYLKSNNLQLSQKITLPNSFSTLESCNPNHVLLKTITKNLIMWDCINNTQQYLFNQIPQLIRFIYDSSLKQVHEQYYLIYNVSEIDYQTVTSIYIGIITGAIVAMGLKYAGTGDQNALKAIKGHIQRLRSLKIIKCEFGNDVNNKNCIDQYQLYSLLSVTVLAMGIVMAGSCDISCLNVIKIIRKKFQDSKVYHYGFNMAMNMSAGFIFLGYGNYTFNRSNMSIASLLISIYPQFPNSPTDNKYHLQALRHFYVLSLEQKIFHTVDVDTNKVISIKTQMQLQVGSEINGKPKIVKEISHTPVLLQQSKRLRHIRIMDDDYFDVDFQFGQHCLQKNIKAIYVKRKTYRDVSKDLLNPENVMSTQNIRQGILHGLNDEPRYRMLLSQINNSTLAKQQSKQSKLDLSYIIGNKNAQSLSKSAKILELTAQQEALKQKYNNLYFQMLKQDKLEILEIYMNMDHQLLGYINNNSNISNKNSTSHKQNHNHTLICSNLHNNLETILNFQKNNQIISYGRLSAANIRNLQYTMVTGQFKVLLELYYNDPHQFIKNTVSTYNKTNKLQQIYRLYQNISMLRVPNASQLSHINKACKLTKNANTVASNNIKLKHDKNDIQLLLYENYGQCGFNVLAHLLQTYWK